MISIPAKAILFDCDGVLVDSDASVLSAWSRWAIDYGFVPAEVVAVVHGRRSTDTVTALIDPARRAEALERIDDYELEDARAVTPISGALDLVATMPTGSWAVVTSGTRALATARLTAAGFPVPAVLITADDVARGKPDPEGYRSAAQQLGVEPGDTVVLEDAPSGIVAARAAHVGAVIGVGARADGVDLNVRDLMGLSWTESGIAYRERGSDAGPHPAP